MTPPLYFLTNNIILLSITFVYNFYLYQLYSHPKSYSSHPKSYSSHPKGYSSHPKGYN
ncbi:MAG: hypothetical protein ACD_26C00055G0004 [uncultured bacterium]|nr:MAG: hypothetical protein ACD_26C00055G0004 [uncultured bacterium]